VEQALSKPGMQSFASDYTQKQYFQAWLNRETLIQHGRRDTVWYDLR
jgi:hypothetical protein